MINTQLKQDIKDILNKLDLRVDDIVVSISKEPKFGDYSTNIPLQLSKLDVSKSYQGSIDIANKISDRIKEIEYVDKIEVAPPGFINIFIKPEYISHNVKYILDSGGDFGNTNLGQNHKIQVEFISANPTGPLTLANGRGGAIGDTLANILKTQGFQVEREYYVNNTGHQVMLLGQAIKAFAGKIPQEENFYKGEYVKDLSERFKSDLELDSLELGEKAANYLLAEEIKPAILRLGINFDRFYLEKDLYDRDLVSSVLDLLKNKNLVYEDGGAIWFKSTEFGDEKDRVLVTSKEARGSSDATYFLADIAHHFDIYKEGFVKRINILGSDHHGYEKRIKAAAAALGYKDSLDIIFMQLVKLFKQGKEVRMSKRAGTFVTLDELLDQVSKDVVRFFFLIYAPESPINFDLDLAIKKSNENPVFYIQYAHARMSNILNKSELQEFNPDILTKPSEIALIKQISMLPELVQDISKSYQVHHLTSFSLKLAELFHAFYESSSVLTAETEELKQSRLALVKASRLVLAKSLNLMGIEAPEKM